MRYSFVKFILLCITAIFHTVKKLIKLFFTKGRKIIYILVFSFTLFTGGIVISSIHKLKTFNKMQFMSNTHYIYDRNGILMGYTSPKISVFTKLEEFPNILKDTIIAVEDRAFYSNIGISFSGIGRSIVYYIPSKLTGYRPRGGSTVTQQLMRQLYLTTSLSFFRKFKEIILSIVATVKISKHDIMEVYMNHAYFCNNIYGFKSAADIFFNKSLNNLTPDEVAVLVAMLKGPEYSPVKNIEKLKSRRNIILQVMLKDKIITQNQYDEAIKQEISFSIERFNHCNFTSLEVKNYIIEHFGEETYNQGGLKIYTALDAEKQKIAEEELLEICIALEKDCVWLGPISKTQDVKNLSTLNNFLEPCGRFYTPVIITSIDGSFTGYKISGKLKPEDIEKYNKIKPISVGDIVIVDKKYHNLTNFPSYNGQVTILKNGYDAGDILASVGGVDLFVLRDDITKIQREVGSCMKMIDILIAFEVLRCNTDKKIIDDYCIVEQNKLKYVSQTEFEKHYENYYKKNKKDIWPPVNWDYKRWGALTLRAAFCNSRNLPMLALVINDINPNRFKKYTDRLKLTSVRDPFYPSYALGSIGTTPRRFTEVLCGVVNYGNKLDSTFVKEVCDENDTIIEKTQPKRVKRIFKESSVYAMLSCMREAVMRGNSLKLKGTMNHIYSKVGTSSNNQEAMCVCINKDFVIFVTICRNNGKSLGHNVWGSAYPVICTRKILERLKDKLLDVPLMDIPSDISIKLRPYNPYGSPVLPKDVDIFEIFFHDNNGNDNS